MLSDSGKHDGAVSGKIRVVGKKKDMPLSLGSYLEKTGHEVNAFSSAHKNLNEIIGRSIHIKRLKELISMIAPLENTVLITGESGTGKELVADMIHSLSKRSNGPFVKINCAAIPESLLESELFGVEKGAFTGAHIQRPGKFELAHHGTILLDEIGDMPFSIQAKLLRVIEQKQIDKLGGCRPISADFRVIASTNQDLFNLICEEKFRQDLYYRLNVVSIYLTPLIEMMDDIPSLVRHFLGKIGPKMGICLEGVTNEAMEILLSYDWPGNVRELSNLLERAAIFCDGNIIGAPEIRMAFHKFAETRAPLTQTPDEQIVSGGTSITLMETLKQVEKTLIIKALLRTNGVQSEAAKILDLSPKNLWKKIQKYSIDSRSIASESASLAESY